jgi:hypothetical protein
LFDYKLRDASEGYARLFVNRRIEMRKIITFAATLILIGVGVWSTKTTPSVDASTEATVPVRLMTNARNLPEAHYVDYTFVFN